MKSALFFLLFNKEVNLLDKQLLHFLSYLKKLEVIEAIGVARLLNIDLMVRKDNNDSDNEKTATLSEKEYDIILSEMIDKFLQLDKNKKKNLLSIMKEATRGVK